MSNKTIQEYLSQPQKEPVVYDCEDCGKHIEKSGRVFRRNPHLKCKACYMKSVYGVTTNIAKPEVREKANETILNKYGSMENFTKDRISKAKKAVLEKYGVENVFAVPEINKRIHESKDYKSESLKRVKTNMQVYGSVSIGKNSHIYKGIRFDSSWELAFWIWCEDNKKKIERNSAPILLSNGKSIYPDFLVDGALFEIKGDYLKQKDDWQLRNEAYIKNNVTVLSWNEMKPYLKYIDDKYGKNYLKKFRIRRGKSIER